MAELELSEHSCNEEIKPLYMIVVKQPSSKAVKVKTTQRRTFIQGAGLHMSQTVPVDLQNTAHRVQSHGVQRRYCILQQ